MKLKTIKPSIQVLLSLFLISINSSLYGQDSNHNDDKMELVGVLNESRVRIRKEPNLDSEQIGYLEKDQIVYILDETEQSMKIGKMDSVWYKIETMDGIVGWSYGYFIDLNIESDEIDYDDYETGYDIDAEYHNDSDDIRKFLDSNTPRGYVVTRVSSGSRSKEEGTPVYTRYSGKIIQIQWYDDDSSWSDLIGHEGWSNRTQGKRLGFYILMQSDNEYYLYAHLNPNAESTNQYLEIFNNNPNSEQLVIPKGIQIGEYGMTGTSWESNMLFAKYIIKSFEELQNEESGSTKP